MRTFRAWIDERGGNIDRLTRRRWDVRLVDLETTRLRPYTILIRVLRRRRPVYLHVMWFSWRAQRVHTLLRIGRHSLIDDTRLRRLRRWMSRP